MKQRLTVWLLALLLAGALVLQLEKAVHHLKASQILEVVKTVTREGRRRGRLTKGITDRNIKLLRQAELLNPAEVLLPIARGGQYVRLKRWESAIRAFETALKIEPRGEIYRHIGHVHLSAGHHDEADEAFRRAILLDHNQRRALKGYLGRLRPTKPAARAPSSPDLIFQSSFESGDLSDWTRDRGRGAHDTQERTSED